MALFLQGLKHPCFLNPLGRLEIILKSFKIKSLCICPLAYKDIFAIRFYLLFMIRWTTIPICISMYRHSYSPFRKENCLNTGIAPYRPSRYALLSFLSYLSLKRSREYILLELSASLSTNQISSLVSS